MSALKSTISAGAVLAIVISALPAMRCAWAADPGNGRQIYDTYCRSCHGDDGRGVVAGAPDFTRGQGLMTADAMIAQSLKAGKGAMPAFQGILKSGQILDVVAYLRTLQR